MRHISRLFAIFVLSIAVVSCSSGPEEPVGKAPADDLEETAATLAPDIGGFLGFYWGDGTEILFDHSMYDIEAIEGSEIYSYNGDPFYIEDFGIEVDYDIYEFVDGALVSGEVGGRNMEDMKKMRDYLVEEYGEPQEVTEGLYEWRSRTGTVTLDDLEVYWRMTAWSENAL